MIPLQHLHPMVVHFPIVLVYLVAGYELIATALGRTVTGRTASGNFSVGLLVLAAIAAVVAYYLGDFALSFAEAGGFESEIAETHETLGKFVAMSLVLWAAIRAVLWWRDVKIAGPVAFVVPAISLLGAGLVTWTAYYGGKLVFDLGVNVGKSVGA